MNITQTYTTPRLSLRSRVQLIKVFTASLLLTLGATGCLVPEEEPKEAPRSAAVQVLHQNTRQAAVELLFNDQPILVISPQEKLGAVELPVISGVFSFRNLGAVDPYFETEVLELAPDQVYSFVLLREEGQDQVLDLTAPPPAPEMGRHWLRFVNLSDLTEGRIFYNRAPLVSLPLESNPSEFINVEAQRDAEMSISNGEGIPIDILEDVALVSGGASIFVIINQGDGEDVELYNLPLMIDYVGFDASAMDMRD